MAAGQSNDHDSQRVLRPLCNVIMYLPIPLLCSIVATNMTNIKQGRVDGLLAETRMVGEPLDSSKSRNGGYSLKEEYKANFLWLSPVQRQTNEP